MWSNDKSVDFSKQLDASEIDNIQADVENDNTDISCILEKIQNLFENTAKTVLGHEREYQIDPNVKQKPIKFDRETLRIRNKYYKAKRDNDGTKEKKDDLIAKSKAYKKSANKSIALHRKQTIKKLRNAKTKNPKFYWSVLNRKSNKSPNRNTNAISLN